MNKKERTISNLSKLKGRVYVYFANDAIAKVFLEQAEKEGYTFWDGVKPTKRHSTKVMAVNHDKTINYVLTNGRTVFDCNAPIGNGRTVFDCNAPIGNENLIKVDFEKYINGENMHVF